MANMMFSRQPRWPCRILAQPSGGPFLGHDGLGGWEIRWCTSARITRIFLYIYGITMDIVVQQNSMVHYFNRLTIEFYYVIMMLKHYIDNICIQYIHYNCYNSY